MHMGSSVECDRRTSLKQILFIAVLFFSTGER